jgi:hypothetical protein
MDGLADFQYQMKLIFVDEYLKNESLRIRIENQLVVYLLIKPLTKLM